MKLFTAVMAVLCAPILVLTEDAHEDPPSCSPEPVKNLELNPGTLDAVVTWSKLENMCPEGKTSIVLSWTSGERQRNETLDGTVERYVVQGLKPWTKVKVDVHVQHTGDNGMTHLSLVETKQITTLKGKPSPPRGIEVVAIKLSEDDEGAEMIVEWKEPETPNGPIDGYLYNVRWGLKPCAEWKESVKQASEMETHNKTWQQVTRLTPLLHYEFSVVAYNKNEGQLRLKSDPAMVCTKAPPPPIKPLEDVKVECTSNPKKVAVSWKEPEDSHHWESYEVAFSVQKDGESHVIEEMRLNNTLACDAGKCAVEVTDGLDEGTEYSITVKPFMKKLATFIEEYSVSTCKLSKGNGQEGLQSGSIIALTLLALLVTSLVKVR
ncbi:receptor-type tyrosine-protein phosphatase delta-like [Ornithodoros turicata]|uniref:receptor-type tyrosine-protein phosphatase delta-like n=1 Tax=Ornithodoros turicata TaxID=34597 RepID=UPI00313966A7